MELDEYQEQARETFIVDEDRLAYLGLGLNGEAGEVAEKLKKVIRGDHDTPRQALQRELGDVLWYTAVLASELDISLSDVADENLAKLDSREHRGELRGDGDDR